MPCRSRLYACLALTPLWIASPAESQSAYHEIAAPMANRTITLTGDDLTIDQIIQIARYGAKVALSPAALQKQADAYGLLLEASTEGIPIYGFNRGAGAGREVIRFKGDPLAPENKEYLSKRVAQQFQAGAREGIEPEVTDEETVRALMAVRANTMVFEAASPATAKMLLDLLNRQITPVVQSRGSLGEADLAPMNNVLGAMGGAGEVHYRGRRMKAADAMAQAGLTPLQPLDAVYTSSLTSTNAFSVGQAALLIHDAQWALNWADLILAMDLEAMNSSVTPLSSPVQAGRPFKYHNLDAARVLNMVKGSYLFNDDDTRIIQDPESQRASFSRQGSAWKAWALLRDTVRLQINSSDHNPAVKVGASPGDSWELNTPQMLKYYVKGGPASHGQHGFIFSNANWDPYPMANEVEALSNALANMDVAVTQRIYRFSSTFFTVVAPENVLSPRQLADAAPTGIGYDPTAISQNIQNEARAVTPEGNPISGTVEELQAQSVLKVIQARQVVDDTLRLLGEDLLTATYWLDVRRTQTPDRNFGAATTAAWARFRETVPWQADPASRPLKPTSSLGYAFLKATPAAAFYPAAAADIDGGHYADP